MDKAYEEILKKLAGIEEEGDKKGSNPDPVSEVIKKVASAEGEVTLTKEEAEALKKILQKKADDGQEAPIQVVDADGDGTPDTIVGDPEVIVSALEELVQAGVLSPMQYQMALQWIQMHLATEESIDKSASAEPQLSSAAQTLLSILQGGK